MGAEYEATSTSARQTRTEFDVEKLQMRDREKDAQITKLSAQITNIKAELARLSARYDFERFGVTKNNKSVIQREQNEKGDNHARKTETPPRCPSCED